MADASARGSPLESLRGQAVAVTGAAAEQGSRLGLVRASLGDRATEVAFDKQAKVEVRAGERCRPFVGDVSVRDCRRAVGLRVERFGSIDVMCAHVGIAEPLPRIDMTEEQLRRHLAVNVDRIGAR